MFGVTARDTHRRSNCHGASYDRTIPLAFVHLPKTGGTTVCDWIDQHFSPDQQLVCDSEEHFRLIATERTGGVSYLCEPMIRGHFDLPDGLKYARMVRHEMRLFFTIVRSPEAQLMSLLWHMVSAKHGLVKGRNHPPVEVETYLSDYIAAAEEFECCPLGSQCSFFCRAFNSVFQGGRSPADLSEVCAHIRESYLDGVHIVGVSERLADSLRLVAWAMRWPAPRNLANARISGAGKRDIPKEVKAILWRRLALDSALHEGAQERFEIEFARLCRAAGSSEKIDDFLDLQAAARSLPSN
jgi:hypothetical protein